MEKETNEKIMAINEYSNTVIESMNKTHNEILFLYNMLNDKHTELTGLASQLQQFSEQVKHTQDEMMTHLTETVKSLNRQERKCQSLWRNSRSRFHQKHLWQRKPITEASTIRYLHFIKMECLMWKLPVSWDGAWRSEAGDRIIQRGRCQ